MGTTTLDDVIRISFLVLTGFALGLAVVWYLHYCYQEISGTGQVVIDPLTVVEDSGKRNEEVGGALALMLQSRLESLAGELRDAQVSVNMSASPPPAQAGAARVGDVRLWTQDIALQAGLLKPVEMKLSVGGVEVGGVVPWLQRQLNLRRTLHFTLYSHGDEAQVFGSVAALRLKGEGVRLLVKGEEGKAPSFDVIVDRLAHEIIRRRLAQDSSNGFAMLRPSEFVTLAAVVVNAADSNRRSLLGRPAQNEFADLVPRITALSDQVPDWPELGYFAGWIADKARDSATAATYYHRVIPKLDATKQDQASLIALMNARLGAFELEGREPTVSAAEPTKPELDYSSEIKRIRDSGPEGSVVGQALATALEFQIAKATHQDHQISARYIYYVARQASGTTEIDSGAQIADGIRALSKRGAVENDVWPYVGGQYAAKPPAAVENAKRFRITDAKRINGLAAVKSALIQNGPVVAGIAVYQSALNTATAKTGVIPLPAPKEQVVGGHAIVIVAYDDKQKRVKFVNSWGSSWGEHGFGYLSYEYVEKYMDDAWTFKAATT